MEMNFQCNQINSHYIQHILSRCFLGRRTTGSNPVTLDPKGSLFTIMDSSGSQPFGLEEVTGGSGKDGGKSCGTLSGELKVVGRKLSFSKRRSSTGHHEPCTVPCETHSISSS